MTKDTIIWNILTFIVTVASALSVVSFRFGQLTQRINQLEQGLAQKADHTDITQIKETLAEIKGMFVLKLRELDSGAVQEKR